MVFKHFVIAVAAFAVAGSSHPPTAPDQYGAAAVAAAAGTPNSEATVQIPQVYSLYIKKRLSELRAAYQAEIRGKTTDAQNVLPAETRRVTTKLQGDNNVKETNTDVEDQLTKQYRVLPKVVTKDYKLDIDNVLSELRHVLRADRHVTPKEPHVLPREQHVLPEKRHVLPEEHHVLPEVRNEDTERDNRRNIVRFLNEKTDETTEVRREESKVGGRRVRDTLGRSGGLLQKRSYSPWSGLQSVQVPDYKTISQYQPPTYQLSRPYFIPVYGAPGRIPIYFPPQSFLLNPGIPKDNPVKRPYVGPTYLPPYPETTTKVKVKDRFNNEYDDEEGPVWGETPPNSDSIIPTRAPKSSTTTLPPLIHEINKQQQPPRGTNHLSAVYEEEAPLIPNDLLSPQSTLRTTTFRPTTARPSSGPSSCVWAIVTCCSASSAAAPESCFEQRGCSGPFWGASPCEGEFAKAAIESAINYYNTDG